VADLERSDAWVTGGRGRAGRSLVVAGATLAVTAVAAGALLAPLLPGVDEPPLVDWRNQGGANNARLLTSPLVDIRSRLVDTSNTELFTVEANAPAYWRIASLDRFDGTQWRLSASTDQEATGRLGGDGSFAPRGARIEQRYSIQQFQSYWLPAAAQAVEFQPSDGSLVRYDRETSTLIAESPTTDGTTYGVLSVVADHSPEQLRTAEQDVPDALDYARDLPDGFSPTAARLAREVTSGRATHYEQALALQTFFRDTGGFSYSTDVNLGQSSDAIDTFLEQKVGYCEQFAGTFAAMARSLGIPARVAVGYTWGEQDPLDPARFQVFGKNAHAWPEVWLGEYGWVAFEPTPGRGNPSAQEYTGVAASQDSGETPATTTTTTAAPDASNTTLPTDATEEAAAAASADTSGGGGSSGRLLAGVGLLLAVTLAYALIVPGALAVRRNRRRGRATTPAGRVGVAWAETSESLTAAGLTPRRDETHAEVAARGAEALPAAAPALERLATAADVAAYGLDPISAQGDDATHAAAEVDRAVDGSLGRLGRLRRRLDPRPLWQGRAARHRAG
jgi:transglutaminase-like putative cysteine protease